MIWEVVGVIEKQSCKNSCWYKCFDNKMVKLLWCSRAPHLHAAHQQKKKKIINLYHGFRSSTTNERSGVPGGPGWAGCLASSCNNRKALLFQSVFFFNFRQHASHLYWTTRPPLHQQQQLKVNQKLNQQTQKLNLLLQKLIPFVQKMQLLGYKMTLSVQKLKLIVHKMTFWAQKMTFWVPKMTLWVPKMTFWVPKETK